VARKQKQRGPRLEALLDERDHLRIQISMAETEGSEDLTEKRRRLLQLDREIMRHWDKPGL
jgi:hypothetical protein